MLRSGVCRLTLWTCVCARAHTHMPHANSLSWHVMDLTAKLDFPDSLFDACIDKGCLDSILCGDRCGRCRDAAWHKVG